MIHDQSTFQTAIDRLSFPGTERFRFAVPSPTRARQAATLAPDRERRPRLVLALAVFLGQAAVLQAGQPAQGTANDPWVPELAIEKYQLANGLTVVLHEDHKSPLVAVNVVYNAGSKDDPPGARGWRTSSST